MANDSVATPGYLWDFVSYFHDPYPKGGFVVDPPVNRPVFANPGYSRMPEAVDRAIGWFEQGNPVMLLIPMGDSDSTRRLIRYGVKRLIPEQRFYENVRNVEIVIVTG